MSEPFSVHRGLKQGSVLSSTLVLTVMDRLLKEMRAECHGLSISQTYICTAIHADDLRTIAESKEVVSKQACVVSTFAKAVNLKLNSSKVEVLRISWKKHNPEVIQLVDLQLSATSAVKCLGVWWQYNMSASRAVLENISKARKAFFALGGTGAFHGSLNPLSGRSIYESCILPILLYSCETWLLYITSIKALENFQCEIGKRILCLPKFHSKNVVRIALHWPSMTTCILIRKLTFLALTQKISSVVAFSHHWLLYSAPHEEKQKLIFGVFVNLLCHDTC